MSDSNEISNVIENNLALNIGVEKLFDSCRILENSKIYRVILYFPFGVILVLLRLIVCSLGFIVLQFLPRASTFRSNIFNGICKVLGLVIEADDKYLDNAAKLLIANHVSILDRIAISAAIPCNIISKNFEIEANSLSFWQDGDFKHLREPSVDGILALQKSIIDSPIPSLYFPECATTNGRVGFLKFHPSVFLLNVAVQPVLIKMSLSSFVDVRPSVLGSTIWSDLFWLFFFPSTLFHLKVLPSIAQLPNESASDFSKRIQKTMACAAGLSPTVYTFVDKADLVKQYKTSKQITGMNQPSASGNLPSTCDDTSKTGCTLPRLTLNTAAKTFGKSPKERMLSYKERKELLIAAAKQKYLEKQSSTNS